MPARLFAAIALFLVAAQPARAQQAVQLQFDNGQVSLKAQNAPVRAILQEWARLGGATIVNGDRVAGPPVTLELAGVPERQALDVVLRSVAGYIVAPRPAGTRGASAFDRILILPTSAAPRNPTPPPAVTRAPVRPGIIPRLPDPNDPPPPDVAEAPDPLDDPSALNTGRDPRVVAPPFVTRPPMQIDENGEQVVNEGQNPGAAAVPPSPANPFGVPAGSSTTPGVIAPVPQVRTPQAPTPTTNRVQ